jgi:hypothetical protein
MRNYVIFIIAVDIWSPYRRSLLLKWYQVVSPSVSLRLKWYQVVTPSVCLRLK